MRLARSGSDTRSISPRTRELLIGALHLSTLWALAFAQPLFDLLSRNAEFFVARGNTAGDLLLFSFGLIVLPPAAMLLVEAVALRVSVKLRAGVHLVLIAALAAALVLQILDQLVALSAGVLIVVALALGALAALACARTRFARTTLTVLSPAPLLFLALFLIFSPVSKLVFPEQDAGAEPSDSVASDAPVVMVAFDELPVSSLMNRGGRIDASRFPAFAALARRATWYPNATTVEWSTYRAVPAILTGRHPPRGALPIAADAPENLFTLLGGELELNVAETSTSLCPAELCPQDGAGESELERLRALVSDLSVVSAHLLLPEELRADLPRVDRTFGDFGGAAARGFEAEEAEGRAASFERFLASIPPRPRTLSFHHSVLPHAPYDYLPSGQLYPPPTLIPNFLGEQTRSASPFLVEFERQRHLLQLGYVDRLLGRLIRRLRALGIWDSALVVVTADHGISFAPGAPLREPSASNLASVANVPLFIKAPGQRRGRRSPRHLCTSDILAEVMRTLEAKPVPGAGPCPDREVRIRGRGRTVRLSLPAFLRQRRRTLSESARQLGAGRGWGAVYHAGAHPRLIGRRRAALASPPSREIRASLVDPNRYRAVDPRGSVVPALVEGTIDGPIRVGAPLAIAVNGRIVAAARVHEARGALGFEALIRPRAFRRGANRVEVLAVRHSAGRLRLEPLGGVSGS